MAEYKQYITQNQENGSVMISEDVIATIAEHALIDVDGVVKGGSEIVGKKSWGKGMRITISEDNTLSIGCNVIVRYGDSVVNVANAVQDAIANAVESVTGVTFSDINVNVCGIVRK
ncbi:MAG TPA: Asp23/Gls24 family envelope stress response protein [Candidatus Faecousia faecavium]|nr:Asp23/Gls24 family envelope stress response protein [Candidatus Faecousia faecavium]